MKIGFIGLGNLGAPIAENVLQKNPGMFVYNRTVSKAQPLADKGAIICSNVKELATSCDIVFSMVADDAALNHITLGENGIATNLKAGGIHISMSTILPETASQLRTVHQLHNSYYVAAPVMGRPEAARIRKLNFLLSGDPAAAAIAKPLLEDAGAVNVWDFGTETQAANVAKLCSNFLIISAIQAMAESINLAKQSGIDPQVWMNMLTQTLFAAPIYNTYSAFLMKGQFQPAAFSLKLGLKDVNLVLEQAAETNTNMPLGKLLQQQLQECMANGLGDYDWTAIALALK
ncbi:MAG TPA: NAD(P)-dependent oxidoreductase [Panacibacter sp.]|nr:NAD(P)-dependent oxidoreductase [Panacibacter sp.]HNP43910.1 NAD(P)-dependent oxidoreductase [Panacibacter sp.]